MTGHIRRTDAPNRRVQDGLKRPWLCRGCEQCFGRFETAFATKVFHPWHRGEQRVIYGPWLLQFCVSVSWRVLKHCKGVNSDHIYSADEETSLSEAERVWRLFLLDGVPHPGSFEQHLLILDTIADAGDADLPDNINRFLTGPVMMDIVGSSRSLMTYAKLGRFNIFGIVRKGTDRWDGTKVHVKHGVLQPGSFTIPYGLLGLFKEKADLVRASYDRISDAQQQKAESALLSNLERARASDQFASIKADVDRSGVAAILRRPFVNK